MSKVATVEATALFTCTLCAAPRLSTAFDPSATSEWVFTTKEGGHLLTWIKLTAALSASF